jgi:Tol biopolymer transport system component
LVWFNREGKAIGSAPASGRYLELKLSPDDKRVAVARRDAKNANIWTIEFDRGTSTRLTFDPAVDRFPIWSPDGSQIVFASARKGAMNLYRKPSSGAVEEEVLLNSSEAKYPTDWSSDGHFLLYTVNSTKTRSDIWMLPMDGERKPVPFLATPFIEGHGQFSPDVHWVAYQSNESGRVEVYVRPFPPSAAGKWMVSNGGGAQPRWRKDGKELFYFSPDNQLMSVEISATGSSFKAGTPKSLFAVPGFGGIGSFNGYLWDLTADGQRFLINTTEDTSVEPITVVLNWTGLLQK